MCIVKKNKKFLALPTPNVINRGGENYTHVFLVRTSYFIKISREIHVRKIYVYTRLYFRTRTNLCIYVFVKNKI